jgi:hypothetical protein
MNCAIIIEVQKQISWRCSASDMYNQTPFFSNIEDKTVPLPLEIAGGVEVVKKTRVVGRNVEYPDVFVSSSSGFGFPGVPFVPGEPNPSTFCQGEDAQFDALLYQHGAPVLAENYRIQAVVKSSLRSRDILWAGEVQSGIYEEDKFGKYTIWIPSKVTADWLAGSYVMNVSCFESIGQGRGVHDRKISLIDLMFNIEYCGGSPNPETLVRKEDAPDRALLEKTWPNSSSTVRG